MQQGFAVVPHQILEEMETGRNMPGIGQSNLLPLRRALRRSAICSMFIGSAAAPAFRIHWSSAFPADEEFLPIRFK